MSDLPPLPTPAPSAAAYPQNPTQPMNYAQQQPPQQRPPGRPPADPEIAQLKSERHAELRQLQNILPKQATDSKIQLYRMRGSRPAHGAKVVLTILQSELEAAGGDPQEYIKERISKLRDPSGRFQCVVVDKQGKRVNEIAPWEASIEEDEEDEEEEIEDELDDREFNTRQMELGEQQQRQVYAPPPVAPPLDPLALSRAMSQERAEGQRQNGDMMAMLTAVMQNSQQQHNNLMQQQAAQLAAQQAATAQAIERDRQRSDERFKNILALIPVALPVLQNLFKREAPPVDTVTPLLLQNLLESVKNKPSEAAMLPAIMGIFTDTVSKTSAMQSAAATTAMNQQAEISGKMTEIMIDRMVKMATPAAPAEAREPGFMEQIAPFIGPAMEMMKNQQAAAPALPAPVQQAPPQQVQQPVQQNPPPQPARRGRPPRRAVAPPSAPEAAPTANANVQKQVDPNSQPPDRRIQVCMSTIRRMSLPADKPNAISPEHRFAALKYCIEWAPENLLVAIKANDEPAVMAIGVGPITTEPTLAAWFSDAQNVEFLRAALHDMRLMLTQTLTKELAQASMAAHRAFLGSTPVVATPVALETPPAAAQLSPSTDTMPVLANANGAVMVAFKNTSGAAVTVPTDILRDGGWKTGKRVSIPEDGLVQGPLMEENDAAWVIMVSADARVRVLKDKFKRQEPQAPAAQQGG